MSQLTDKQTRLAANLKMYASGSGVLSFTFESYHKSSLNEALSEKVTEKDIIEYLALKNDDDLMNNYKLIKDANGDLALMLKIERISDNVLKIPFFDKTLLAEYKKDDRYDFGFKLTELKGEQFEIRHISTKAAVKYFLNNEERIK